MLDRNGLFEVDQCRAGLEVRLAEQLVHGHGVGSGVRHVVSR